MITPRTLQGFFDYLPQDMLIRQYVKDTWRGIFEKYGYGQLETPSLEYAEILFGKYGEEEKLIYNFKDHGQRHVALRYDQTVPLARVIAQNLGSKITLPFKRYEIGRVWRADAARKGRKREFYQCDADIIGSSSLLCEAEILSLLHDGFNAFGLTDHVIVISHRSLLKVFLEELVIPKEKVPEIYRAVDKYDKIGLKGVEKELENREIPRKKVHQILNFIDNSTTDNQKALQNLEKNIGKNKDGREALKQIHQLISYLTLSDIASQNYRINQALVRGLDYYTGIVFEVTVPRFGTNSLAGGGRYDDLLTMFTHEKITGTGVGIGFEPLCMALEELHLHSGARTISDILVTIFDKSLIQPCLEITHALRKQGVKAELYLIEDEKIGKQVKYADKKNIPYTLVYGLDEHKEKTVILKNMNTGEQQKIKKTTFLQSPKQYLVSKT